MRAVVLTGGELHDGTGVPPVRADLVIADGRIVGFGADAAPADAERLDVGGHVVAPGFVDSHSHSDFTLWIDPRAVSSVMQGVTTEIVGNCGHGCSPLIDRLRAGIAIYGPTDREDLPPSGFGDYLDGLDRRRPAVNVLMLVPNGQLRLGVVGLAPRPATPEERSRMLSELGAALEAGGAGFSTGLEYAVEGGADEAEVASLAAVAGRAGGIYATHTRNRDEAAVAAVEEAIRTAEAAEVRLQISHITPRGGMADIERCLDLALAARRRGNPVGFDMHTRVFGFTHLKNVVPAEALEGGAAAIRMRLADPATRALYRRHLNLLTRCSWDRVVLSRSAVRPDLEGLDFAEIGRRLGTDAHDAAFDLLAADADRLLTPMVILRTYDEDQLRTTYLADDCMIGSDATALAPDGPLASETFHGAYTWAAWFWRRMVRETRTFSRAEAIRRMTGLPASVFGLADRGRLAPGLRADVVVLDPDRFGERGTVDAPNVPAVGVSHLFVNGVHTLRDGVLTGDRGGSVLRRAAPLRCM